MDLARASRFPVSKSAPLADWAFMILSVSSNRVGMKRRAMVIIMDISCTGKRMYFRGLSTRSRASVRAMGEVVKVKSEVPRIKKTNRRDIKAA